MKQRLFSILLVMALAFTSQAQVVTYDIAAGGLIGMTATTPFEDYCFLGDYKQSTTGSMWGITWTSTNTNTPVSVTAEILFTMEEGLGPYPVTLNANPESNSSPSTQFCVYHIQTFNLTPTNYNPNAANFLMLDYTASGKTHWLNLNFGWSGGSYARVTVDYGSACADVDSPYIIGSTAVDTSIYQNDSMFQILLSEPILCSTIAAGGSDFLLDCSSSTTATACNSNSVISAAAVSCANDTTRYIQIELDNPTPFAYMNDWRLAVSSSVGIEDTCSNLLKPTGDAGATGSAIILPIELLTFGGKWMDNGMIELAWSTAVEERVDYFVIEHAIDGELFEESGLQRAKGHNSTYVFIDPKPSKQENYYRLKFQYKGQTTGYSLIAWIHSNTNDHLTIQQVYPVPVRDQLNFTIAGISQSTKASIEIIDMVGKLQHQETQTLKQGTQPLRVNASQLAAGVYYLQVFPQNGDKLIQKFVKQ